MKRTFQKSVMLFSIVTAAFTACDKDTNVITQTPASLIAASELLTIPATVAIPENLPAGNTRVATYYAEGVQKYKAQARAGTMPVIYDWVLVAPKADLYNAANVKVGTHTAGPTWQLNGTSDSIYAQHYTPAKTATSPDGSIDWLSLMPKAGKTPTGMFTNVIYIQRIATTGGKAPASLPAAASDTIDVPYTAIYRFTKKNP